MNIIHPNTEQYEYIYGDLPDTQEELISCLEKNMRLDFDKIQTEEERIRSIEWDYREVMFYMVPKGTPRPRTSPGHFYVKGAKQMKNLFSKYLKEEGLICTRCELELTVWMPTPCNSMTNTEIYLAEKGLIRPIIAPDFDNLAKTYTDALQGVLIYNDNIINPGHVEKYYSIKPRIKLCIKFAKDFDCNYNRKKTLVSVNAKSKKGVT